VFAQQVGQVNAPVIVVQNWTAGLKKWRKPLAVLRESQAVPGGRIPGRSETPRNRGWMYTVP
jgi:hypothetical protein